MLKSGFAFLRNFVAPLEVDTQSSVLLLLLQKKRWIAIVEQPDWFVDVLCVHICPTSLACIVMWAHEPTGITSFLEWMQWRWLA